MSKQGHLWPGWIAYSYTCRSFRWPPPAQHRMAASKSSKTSGSCYAAMLGRTSHLSKCQRRESAWNSQVRVELMRLDFSMFHTACRRRGGSAAAHVCYHDARLHRWELKQISRIPSSRSRNSCQHHEPLFRVSVRVSRSMLRAHGVDLTC